MEKTEYILEFERPLRELDRQLVQLRKSSEENKLDVSDEIEAIEKKIEATKQSIYSNLSPWQKVQIARHPRRPYALDYIKALFTGFQEYHGDRCFGDDRAIVGGTAFFNGQAIVVVGQQKGRDTKENLMRNFGCPHPEGYRKALRIIRMAEKFQLPLVTLIDTPGAFPGIGAEERHVSEAIAVNLREMSLLSVPNIAVIIGEGGSGGALGIGVANRVLILENAYYSVISPEGCAAILWKDRSHAPRAAEALKLGARDLEELELVDEILKEPYGGAHNDPGQTAKTLGASLQRHFEELSRLTPEELRKDRYAKYRAMGRLEEAPPATPKARTKTEAETKAEEQPEPESVTPSAKSPSEKPDPPSKPAESDPRAGDGAHENASESTPDKENIEVRR